FQAEDGIRDATVTGVQTCALPIFAIVALVVAGALIAGAFFAGTQEQRVGENSRRSYQSFGIAEAGANEIIRNWDPVKYNQRRVYPRDSVAYGPLLSPGGTGTFGGYVYKLNDET